jgi:hypothetical protein
MADFDMAVHGDVEPEAEIGPICGNVSCLILLFAKDKEDSLMSFLGAGVAIVKCRRGLRTKVTISRDGVGFRGIFRGSLLITGFTDSTEWLWTLVCAYISLLLPLGI